MPASSSDSTPDAAGSTPGAAGPAQGATRRYGSTPLTFILGVVVATVFTLGWGIALVSYNGSMNGIPFQTLTWNVVSEEKVSITFQVSGDDPAVCVITAKDARHVEIGQADVEIGSEKREVTADIETVREASMVEVLSCREQGSTK